MIKSSEITDNKSNTQIFQVGDRAKALKNIVFLDRTTHCMGQIYDVTKDNVDYYNVCSRDYKKV